MTRRNWQLHFITALWAAFALAGRAHAQNDAKEGYPAFFVQASGGYSVYKSALVQSNDTSTTTAYGFGIYGGENHVLGMMLNRESSKFTFALNKSSLEVAWQDVHLRYRLGPVHFGILVSSSNWIAKAPPDSDGDGKLDQDADAKDLINIATTGYGGNAGFAIPVGKRSSIYSDVTFVTTGFVQQKAPAEGDPTPPPSALGPRMDIEIGGSLALTKNVLSGTCGFKYRTYNVTVDSKAYKEQLNTTYVGILAGWNF